MSIRFISGKPGGGKTLRAVNVIFEELRHTDRNIITNVPLKRGRCREYLQEKYGTDFNFSERVRSLKLEEVGQFYLHYGNDGQSISLDKRVVVKHQRIKGKGG